MKEFWNVIQAIFAAVGGWLGYFLGGNDGLLYALLAFVVLDYITGVMCAVADKKLSSAVGFKGICRKVLIFALVGIGHLLDTHIFGEAGVLRTAIIFFYISNEGLSLVENAAYLGLPIPTKLHKVLEQLHDRSEKEDDGKDGEDGRVALYVEEKNRSWCTSSNANDQRAITIECASDTTEPYAFRDVVYQTLIKLCIDICKRNGKNKLIWFGDKDKTLNYSPKSGEMILTVHRWFANKSCPGNWMYARMGDLAEKVTKALQGSSDSGGGSTAKGTQASVLKDLSEADAIKKVGALFTADQKKSGILASVSLAQFILESGYGKSELAQNANNIFGMKCSLSGNSWNGSSWDGKSKYTKKTQEQNPDGSMVTITADFRKYPCIEDSIADHSAYLLGAKNGSKLRYDGLKGCTDYKKAVKIIKDGGYATSLTYVEKLISIIEKWNLTQYDVKDSGGEVIRWYRVRKSWADAKSQKGAYKILGNAKKCADQNPGYKVFDADGKVVYEPKAVEPAVKVPFLVKVSISDLNIRKGPGTDYDRVQFIPIGVYTIMEVRSGKGSSAGWGRLKSGIGWISLDFVRRI